MNVEVASGDRLSLFARGRGASLAAQLGSVLWHSSEASIWIRLEGSLSFWWLERDTKRNTTILWGPLNNTQPYVVKRDTDEQARPKRHHMEI